MHQITPHLQPGTLLAGGKYRIRRFLGAGTITSTYEAELTETASRVVIKEFYLNSICNREANGTVSIWATREAVLFDRSRDKFVSEARDMLKISHPNIVHILDILEQNGTSYYVMDYIGGRSLQSVIEQDGALPEEWALYYIGQIMDALECMHGYGILNLDVNPNNIIIDDNGNAILIDFGVAKQYYEWNRSHVGEGLPGPVAAHIPIEQMNNRTQRVNQATDIYALATTLYTALTGLVPPNCIDLFCGAPLLKTMPPEISEGVRSAICAMMQLDSLQRPQTISSVRDLLAYPCPPQKRQSPCGRNG